MSGFPLWVVGLLLAALSSASAQESVLIGVYLPLSGNLGTTGRQMLDGIRVAHKLRPRVLDRPVELKITDTKSIKAGEAEAVFRLVEKERVTALIGETFSKSTNSPVPCVERRDIPVVCPGSGVGCKENTLPGVRTDIDQAMYAVNVARNNFGAKTAVIISDISDVTGLASAAVFKREFVAAGGDVLQEIRIKNGDRDFTGPINQIRKAKPDIIYAPIYHIECALIARQARNEGVNVAIIAGDTPHMREFTEFAGKAAENVFFTRVFGNDTMHNGLGNNCPDPMLKEMEIGRRTRDAQHLGANAYFMIMDAIAKADSAQPSKIRDALYSLKCFPEEAAGYSQKEAGSKFVR